VSSAIIVGGGILGVSTAWRLAEAGVDVTLVEADRLGNGASHASFAWINASKKPPFPYHQLNVAGMNYYRRLQSELDQPRWLHFDGQVEWDASEGGADTLREKAGRLHKWGYASELLPVSELKQIEPDLVAPSHLEEFALYSQEGYITPIDMIGDFASRARALGVDIREETPVQDLIVEGSRVSGVVTRSGDRLMADTVVLCNGAVAPHLLEQAGFTLPMAPTYGMVAVTNPSTVRLKVVHHNDDLNMRPDGAGRVMMRHYDFDDMVNPDVPEVPIPGFVDELLARAVKVLPGLAGSRIEGVRITTRPIPGDGKSVVGSVPGVDGLYAMVTHSGVTMGPLLGHIAAREITTGRLDSRLEEFRPGREIQVAQKAIQEN